MAIVPIFCSRCSSFGHLATVCPNNPTYEATAEQQERAHRFLEEALEPLSSWWFAVAAVLLVVAVVLLLL